MQRVRRFIRTWLGFSRTETNGFLILLPLMTLAVASAPLYQWFISRQPRDFTVEYAQLDSIVVLWDTTQVTTKSKAAVEKSPRFRLFNPNSASVDELVSMGFSKHLSKRIASYRQKGGVFRVKRDLLKIYGVDSTYYNQLYKYIDLPENAAKNVAKVTRQIDTERNTIQKIDLNDADTLQLKKVKGIGKVLATRIIKFREALGGFISPDQLKEIYGLDSTTVSLLLNSFYVEENFEPSRISINTADQTALEHHPYISRSLARAIISYRYQHGRFRDTEELRKLLSATPQQAEKLLPYLTVND